MFFAVIMMALALPKASIAYDFSAIAPSGQTLFYKIENGSAKLCGPAGNNGWGWYGYYKPNGVLTIPNSVSYNGANYYVTSIGAGAFYECSGLTEVTIPNTVTYIGDHAFSGCSGMTSINIPNSVTSIINYAFSNCSGLTSIDIPNSVSGIAIGAFSGCSGLISITVDSANPFYDSRNNCNAIIDTYNNRLITGCQTTIIPNTVTSIFDDAFYYCSNLTTITIPTSVTHIGNSAFCGCSGITSITVPNSVTAIMPTTFANCSSLLSVSIPNTVNQIGHSAFSGCSSLISITLPSGISAINASTFSGCSSLTSVTIPPSVSIIGGDAFLNCSSLISVSIPDSVTTIGSQAFQNCSSMTSVIIGKSVATIGEYAFAGCGNMTNLYFNAVNCASMGTISRPVFNECNSLSNIICGDSVSIIPDYAFYGLYSLHTITLGNALNSIGCSSFSNCSNLSLISLPNSLNSINNRSFENCSALTSITIPSGVNSLGEAVFVGCSGLVSAVLPTSLPFINNSMFWGCSSLTSIIIPRTVAFVGAGAFFGCTRLTSITSLPIIAPTLGGNAFAGVSNTIPVNIPCNSLSSYQSVWGCFSNYNQEAELLLRVYSADIDKGIVNIQTHPTCQNPVAVLHASPYPNYHFTYWNDGCTENPRTITITHDTMLTAHFDTNMCTVTLLCDNDNNGSVSGGGTYDYLDTIELIATPVAHYHFIRWSWVVGNHTEYSSANPLNWVVSNNSVITAHFVVDTHTVNVSSNDMTWGHVYATGTLFPYGSPCMVTAIENNGYVFSHWSDGETLNPYTFAVLQDTTLVAIFEAETQGINNVIADDVNVYSLDGQIVVETELKDEIGIYDIVGRKVDGGHKTRFYVPVSGVYLVKIGALPTQKVVVVK